MKLWFFVILLLFCNRLNGLSLINNINRTKNELSIIKKNKIINNIKRKTGGFLNIIRAHNIIPTLFLSFTGGWIVNPSIRQLLSSPKFIVTSINSVSVMSISMIVNDLFDLEIDKINNPKRPLVTGEVTKKEAMVYNCLLVALTEILSFKYLTPELNIFVNLALLNVTIYTPVLKRILFIKNLSCAFLISFSIFFSGLASISLHTLSLNNKSSSLLWVAARTIFLGSLFNELLLDMHDYEGDKQNNIHTFPVVFGLNNSWFLANIIMKINILWNSLQMMHLFDFQIGIILLFILSPILYNLKNIKKDGFSKDSIIKSIKETNSPLFILLIYLCILAKI